MKEMYDLHASVLQYLHSPSAKATTDVFEIPDKDAIKKFIRCLVGRLRDSVKSTAGGTTSAEDNTATDTSGQSQTLIKLCQISRIKNLILIKSQRHSVRNNCFWRTGRC